MNTITSDQLLNLSKKLEGEVNAILHIVSPAQMRKTGNPYNDRKVMKYSTLTGVIGKKYSDEMKVVTSETSEKYEVNPRTWGKLINPYVVEHKEKYYLQIFVDSVSDPVYKIHEFADGDIEQHIDVPAESLSEWLTISNSQDITVRDIKFENIKRVALAAAWELV